MNTAPETKQVLPALVSGGQIRAIIPQDFDQAWRIALAISKAGMSPPGLESPEKITIAIMAGLEVGLPPMQAIQSIAVINNRPSIYGDGALALVRASGLLEQMEETSEGGGDNTTAICRVKRRGEPKPTVRQFSVADAKKAGLWSRKGPWEHYPQRMLAMRARAFALRDGFADILRGLGVAEEQADIKPALPQPPAPPPDDAIPDFGANVVEQDVGARPETAGATGSGEAPTSPQPPSAAATDLFEQSIAIEAILGLAHGDGDEDDRLADINRQWPIYQKKFEKTAPEFLARLFSTAERVARGEQRIEDARKELEKP